MPPYEYDPLFASAPPDEGPDDLERVHERFAAASRPYLRSPWPWLAWAALLPGAALATEPVLAARGPAAVLLVWSGAILAGGAVEAAGFLAGRRGDGERRSSPLARWVLRLQGNTSLVAVALSAALLWQGEAALLPGLWLLLLGHSFYSLGGLALPAFKPYGLVLQLGGLAALLPGVPALAVFAAATGAGNLWMAFAVWRRRTTG
jgi:hypothetical protein